MAKKETKSKGWVAKVVILKGKAKNSRKGKYVYIKKEGVRGKHFKLKPNMSIKKHLETFLMAYESGVKTKRKGVHIGITPKDLVKRTRSKGLYIDQMVKKGIWTTHLKNASKMTPQQVKASYKELLRGAIISRDEQTLNLLVQDSNIEKLKHRFEFRIDITDDSGTILVNLSHVGRKDLQQVVSEMKRFFKSGENLTDKSPNKAKELNNEGYNYFHKENGRAFGFDIKLIMRRG